MDMKEIESKLPKHLVELIYQYDPTYRRYAFQEMLKEIPWTVSIWNMIASQKAFTLSPTEGVEFKEET